MSDLSCSAPLKDIQVLVQLYIYNMYSKLVPGEGARGRGARSDDPDGHGRTIVGPEDQPDPHPHPNPHPHPLPKP